MPVQDSLRNLWMSFLVPTNPALFGLKKSQLLNYCVCAKHFDRTQFDEAGSGIRYSYHCLFTASEIAHGVPLNNEDKHLDSSSKLKHQSTMKNTAEAVEFLDDLFDSVNKGVRRDKRQVFEVCRETQLSTPRILAHFNTSLMKYSIHRLEKQTCYTIGGAQKCASGIFRRLDCDVGEFLGFIRIIV